MFRIDRIKFRFSIIKWSVLLVGFALPIVAWFVTSEYFYLDSRFAFLAFLGALGVTGGMFRLFNNYAAEGFARSYANGGTWDYLASRFAVEQRPAAIDSEDVWSGPSQLDRKDVVFDSDIAVSETGVYININALGRILIPWKSISVLNKHRIPTEKGWQQIVSVVLAGPEIDLRIPWQTVRDQQVLHTVRIN